MSAFSDLLTLCGLLLLPLFLSWVGRHFLHRPAEPLCLTGREEISQLLSEPLHTQLRRRAISNVRLIRAFGITNTFVSDSVDVHKTFTREARRLILAAGSNDAAWTRVADVAAAAVDTYLASPPSYLAEQPGFDIFIQFVAFSTMLSILFGAADQPSVDDVLVVTRGINDLWRLSKTNKPLPPDMLEDINSRLRCWIPAHPNPLDFILPVFETMWRVVAVAIAYVLEDHNTKKMLADFLDTPTIEQFACYTADMPSVESVIAEAMRLHPPTRRIHRAGVASPSSFPSWCTIFLSKSSILRFVAKYLSQMNAPRTGPAHVADIGTVHRAEDIWGDDAGAFRPMRHHPSLLTEEQRLAFMPFGAGRLKCVASGWAPHAAAVIVGAVLSREGNVFEVQRGGSVGGREGWEGWKIEMV